MMTEELKAENALIRELQWEVEQRKQRAVDLGAAVDKLANEIAAATQRIAELEAEVGELNDQNAKLAQEVVDKEDRAATGVADPQIETIVEEVPMEDEPPSAPDPDPLPLPKRRQRRGEVEE